MVAIIILQDNGDSYHIGNTAEYAQKVTPESKMLQIQGVENRLRYLARAFDLIEGGQDNDH